MVLLLPPLARRRSNAPLQLGGFSLAAMRARAGGGTGGGVGAATSAVSSVASASTSTSTTPRTTTRARQSSPPLPSSSLLAPDTSSCRRWPGTTSTSVASTSGRTEGAGVSSLHSKQQRQRRRSSGVFLQQQRPQQSTFSAAAAASASAAPVAAAPTRPAVEPDEVRLDSSWIVPDA